MDTGGRRFDVAQLLPCQWAEPRDFLDQVPEVRLHQAVLMDAIWTLERYRRVMAPGEILPAPVRDVVSWLTDPDGREHDYAMTYAQALAVGYPALDSDVVTKQLLAFIGIGGSYVPGKLHRRHLVRGLPVSVARAQVKLYRPQVGRGHRLPPEDEEEACHG